MSRPRSESRQALLENATKLFWLKGYTATAMDDLVQRTGVSRSSIYSEYGGKKDLFLACLDYYAVNVVTPRFGVIEAEGAGLDAIDVYFERQFQEIGKAGKNGHIGCLMGNTQTEIGSRDKDIQAAIRNHGRRFYAGFRQLLANEAGPDVISEQELDDLAVMLCNFTQGLLAQSKTLTDIAPLRTSVQALLSLLRDRLQRDH